MGEINKVSEKIGELTSAVKAVEKTVSKMYDAQQENLRDMYRIDNTATTAHKRIDALDTKVGGVSERVTANTNFRYKIAGIALCISGVFGFIGSILGKIFVDKI